MSNWIDDTINAIEKIVDGAVETGRPYPAREVERAIARNYRSSHEISSQADDMFKLIEMHEEHIRQRRLGIVVKEFGPVVIHETGGRIPMRIEAYFDNYLDYDMPGWARGFGATEAEAVDELLAQAEDKLAEHLDAKYQGELQRRAGCND